jgi:hypothetical protein
VRVNPLPAFGEREGPVAQQWEGEVDMRGSFWDPPPHPGPLRPRGRRGWCLLGLALMIAPGAHAALAPNYERIREIGEILQNQDLIRKLGLQPIDGIEVAGENTYRIWTEKCIVIVKLVSTPNAPPVLGPWQFSVQVGDPQCH